MPQMVMLQLLKRSSVIGIRRHLPWPQVRMFQVMRAAPHSGRVEHGVWVVIRQLICPSVAGLLRSDDRVGQELPYPLRAAARDGDLGSPLQRLLA